MVGADLPAEVTVPRTGQREHGTAFLMKGTAQVRALRQKPAWYFQGPSKAACLAEQGGEGRGSR